MPITSLDQGGFVLIRITVVLLVCAFPWFHPAVAVAREPGFELVIECRKNLRLLKEATQKYLDDGNVMLPAWDSFANVKGIILTMKYLPQDPVKPTEDCEYFIIRNQDSDQFDWYCDLHGLLEGDRTITFRYHEYQFSSKVNTIYMSEPKYKVHADNLLRRVNYSPTLVENIKFRYRKSPTTTIIIVIVGLWAGYFALRNFFAP